MRGGEPDGAGWRFSTLYLAPDSLRVMLASQQQVVNIDTSVAVGVAADGESAGAGLALQQRCTS